MSDFDQQMADIAAQISQRREEGKKLLADVKDMILQAMAEKDAEIAALRAELEAVKREAVEVVRPFADLAGAVFRTDEDGREMNAHRRDDQSVWGFDNAKLSYGHLRAARAFTEKHG